MVFAPIPSVNGRRETRAALAYFIPLLRERSALLPNRSPSAGKYSRLSTAPSGSGNVQARPAALGVRRRPDKALHQACRRPRSARPGDVLRGNDDLPPARHHVDGTPACRAGHISRCCSGDCPAPATQSPSAIMATDSFSGWRNMGSAFFSSLSATS